MSHNVYPPEMSRIIWMTIKASTIVELPLGTILILWNICCPVLLLRLIYGNFTNIFTCRFYTSSSQKRKSQSSRKYLFTLLESACVKALSKLLVELSPVEWRRGCQSATSATTFPANDNVERSWSADVHSSCSQQSRVRCLWSNEE